MAFNISKGKTVDGVCPRCPNPQIENEIMKLRKENAYLKMSLDELSRQKGAPWESENNTVLLERILALETLKERNSQQILARDQEIASLREQLCSDNAEVVASLQAQLNQQKLDAGMRENLFQSLKQETDELKTKLVVMSAKCQENTTEPTKDGSTDRNVAVIQEHLKDALEKNQQWLSYDQQREAYVRTVMERMHHLEQELRQANEALQQKDEEARLEALYHEESLQHHAELLRSTRADLEVEREKAKHLEEKQREAQRRSEEERRRAEDALEDAHARLEEEKLRSSVLLEQVNHFQKVILTQQDDENRMSVLEQQIQVSAKDLEEEKRDNHHLQRHLHKVLKELRKAKDRAARLEGEKERAVMPSSHSAYTGVERATTGGLRSRESPTKAHGLLDESFLECPNCRAQYPTSRHRELLMHIDQCLE
ncbi:centrosomal protein of 55 kDa-like isoform X2 [Brachyhypopomus gauderio]|uniref:centrosomal protein of 55 kDa-like isoform X2 n=1 Tax=Brachyhypopomus gauderio TaxID=698409 RepID=UPI0040433223